MGNAAGILTEVSKEKAQALAASLWDEELWNKVAGERDEITVEEWFKAVKDAEANQQSSLGTRFRWYAKVKRIGKGSFGVVDLVKGQDRRLYVMKIILQTKPKTSPSGAIRSDIDEANVLKTLSHPNIVEFKEAFTEGRHLCIIMAYCESGDLKQRIKMAQKSGKLFKQSLVMDWFVQMAQGLEYLHKLHIMHRDLKPQNIFLTSGNRIVKIGDFGVTSKMEGTRAMAETVVGTPYYMSPELATNEPYSQKNDVWALGCILSEVCSTEVPFPAENFPDLYKAITTSDPSPIPESYGADLSRIINWMLTKDANQRPLMRDVVKDPFVLDSIKDFKERLGDILKEGPKSETEIEKMRADMAKLQRKKQKYTAALAQIMNHDSNKHQLSKENQKKVKTAEKSLRSQLADVQVQIYVLEKQLADTETTDTKEVVNHFERTLNGEN